jgi:hypothetical protein
VWTSKLEVRWDGGRGVLLALGGLVRLRERERVPTEKELQLKKRMMTIRHQKRNLNPQQQFLSSVFVLLMTDSHRFCFSVLIIFRVECVRASVWNGVLLALGGIVHLAKGDSA